MSGPTILVFFAIVALVLIGLWFGAKRKKELTAWATNAGLTFSPRSDRSYDDRYPEFGCLHRGHSRSAYNIASGLWNSRPLEAFDYRYVTGHGKNRATHTFLSLIHI